MTIRVKNLPGPKGAPVVGNLFRLDLPNLHRQIEQWADEYGDVYCLDVGVRKQLVVTRPSMIQAISLDRPDTFARAKSLDRILRDGGVHGVFNAEGEEWKRHRNVVAKGLDVRHLQKFYPSLEQKVERLYQKWKKNAEEGSIFDIQKDLLRFTVDVTTDLAFGHDINTLGKEGGVIQDHMEKIFPMLFKRINQPFPFYRYWKTKADKEFDTAVSKMNKLVKIFIEETRSRMEANPKLREEPENLIESILVAAEEEGAFSDDEIRGNLLTLLMAGEDTTALTLSWMLVLLTENKDIEEKIREEVNSLLPESKWPEDYASNSKLRYIEGVAMEALRFKPIAPIILHSALKDTEIEGIEIKKGQMVLTQYRHGALSDLYFTEAKKFRPERWLKESRCPMHNTDAFTPFGAGPRFCPGRNLAILEIRAVIAMLYRNFEIEMITAHKEIPEIMAFTMMAGEYRVKLRVKSAELRVD